jgi:hypothetical protein
MTDAEQEQVLIDEGTAAQDFLSSEAGKAVLDRISKAIYYDWRVGHTPQEREACHLRFQAFNAFQVEMIDTAGKGKAAAQIRVEREKRRAMDAAVYK